MLSVATAVQNYLCRDCGATINLRRLAAHDRRTWFACGLCPDCVGQPAGHPLQGVLFTVDSLAKPPWTSVPYGVVLPSRRVRRNEEMRKR